MPRLIDSLDYAIGRTPDHIDTGVDYLTQVPCPEKLIAADGTYNAGWFPAWTGALNVEDSSAFKMAFHRFFHLTLDTPEHFIVWNIADFSRAGNSAILVADKQTGRFTQAGHTSFFTQNQITVSDDGRRFSDPGCHSLITLTEDDQRIRFSMHIGHVHLMGEAEVAIGPLFVQCTRFHRGRGSLQWYGNLRLLHGTLSIKDRIIPLPAGALGTLDRTLGHQRGLQNWNWVAAVGTARCLEDGRTAQLGLQVHTDRAGARPRVASSKNLVWVDGAVHKIPASRFQYTLLNEADRTSGPWRITSPDQTDPRGWLDLTLTPRFHRRERRRRVLINVDFNQYYGLLSGRLQVAGETWELTDYFACAEDSLLQF